MGRHGETALPPVVQSAAIAPCARRRRRFIQYPMLIQALSSNSGREAKHEWPCESHKRVMAKPRSRHRARCFCGAALGDRNLAPRPVHVEDDQHSPDIAAHQPSECRSFAHDCTHCVPSVPGSHEHAMSVRSSCPEAMRAMRRRFDQASAMSGQCHLSGIESGTLEARIIHAEY